MGGKRHLYPVVISGKINNVCTIDPLTLARPQTALNSEGFTVIPPCAVTSSESDNAGLSYSSPGCSEQTRIDAAHDGEGHTHWCHHSIPSQGLLSKRLQQHTTTARHGRNYYYYYYLLLFYYIYEAH